MGRVLRSWAVLVAIELVLVASAVALWVWTRSVLVDASTVAAVVVVPCAGAVRWVLDRRHAARTLDDDRVDELRQVPAPVMEGFRVVGGRLPRIGELSLTDLRVKPSIQVEGQPEGEVAYIDRDIDQDLYNAVLAGGLVVVRGPSGAGKSRAAAQAVNRLSGDRLLLVPESASAVRALAAADRSVGERGAVVWLDDLERFLVPGGLDRAVLDRLCEQEMLLVSTLRREEWAKLDPDRAGLDATSRQIAQMGTDVLAAARTRLVVLPGELSKRERPRAEAHQDDPRVALGLNRAGDGLFAYLAGGPQALDRWHRGTGWELVPGQAVVSAAVDCRRAGYHAFIPGIWAEELCMTYVPAAFRHHPELDLQAALRWAAEPARDGTAGCLEADGTGFRAVDYLLDRADDPTSPLAGREVPDAVWAAVLAFAKPGQAFSVGTVAYYADRFVDAETAMRTVIEARGPASTTAMFNLGFLREEDGDLREAEVWYRRAAEAGDSRAMVMLEILWES